ncbi:putative MFS family arabinose efflux permease [Pseudomonas duriflava]|uniref:Putative MFS family arabinose efflux permease n=1 Tax=Pseudomonas duriflava TaxID=459528 RepID=A0A562Q9W4_9PSED|nr:MFS transporter [Pseudomonas duriflava]TWI53555.1 putative MFS family arabinose efflux permease [Pseudomonas duriflava]
MGRTLSAFRALYVATLLMLMGSGLLSTYLALRLAGDAVDGTWIGALTGAQYLGLVLGGKLGHRLIARVGHIRAYVACAGVVTAAVLAIGVLPWLPIWLVLRMLVGVGMMCQYMVLESWLNDQAEPGQRGTVFSGYMAASYLGLVLGQVVLIVWPDLGNEKLMLIGLCFALCLVPVAVTHNIHPAPMSPAPLEPRFFLDRVPQSLTTTLIAGLAIGSFYGLAPVYAAAQELPTERIGLFMGCCIFAGLLAQWPIGWLSDRYDRTTLIRYVAMAMTIVGLPLALLPHVPLAFLLLLGFMVSLLLFVLYPLAVALSNDHIEAERRVSLTAMLLVTFGVGACIGPLLVGGLMNWLGANMLYAFISLCGLILVWRIRPQDVTGLHRVEEAPLHHVPMPDSLASSPLVASLDPRVDEQLVQEQMQTAHTTSSPVSNEETELDEVNAVIENPEEKTP